MTTATAAVPESRSTTASPSGTAVLVGLLFLTATATFLVGDALIADVLDGPDYPVGASAHAAALTTGALLAFVDGLAVVGIALLLFPLLKRHSEPLALGYVGFRVAELAAILLYLAVPLLVVQLGDLPAAGAEPFGDLLRAQYDVALVTIYLFTGVAGTILATALYRSRLIPRPLAVLGLVGYPVLLGGTLLHMFGLTDVTEGAGLLAVAPGGLFELVLPIWLITKGFSSSDHSARAVSADEGRVE